MTYRILIQERILHVPSLGIPLAKRRTNLLYTQLGMTTTNLSHVLFCCIILAPLLLFPQLNPILILFVGSFHTRHVLPVVNSNVVMVVKLLLSIILK